MLVEPTFFHAGCGLFVAVGDRDLLNLGDDPGAHLIRDLLRHAGIA